MTKEANSNCLDGAKCPKCGSLEPFHIEAITTALVYDDGTDSYEGADWEDHHTVWCKECDWQGTVAELWGATEPGYSQEEKALMELETLRDWMFMDDETGELDLDRAVSGSDCILACRVILGNAGLLPKT